MNLQSLFTRQLLLLLLLFAFTTATAQITVLDTKKLDQIKEGETYVVIKSIRFPGADKWLEQMQKNWTLSKGLHFLAYEDLGVKIKPNDSFLSLEALTVQTPMTTGYVTNIWYYLSFWTVKERFFKKDRNMKDSDHEPVANIYLSVDPKAFSTKKFFDDMDFDGGGLLYNWSPGMVHNYLQQLTLLLNNKKKIEIKDDFENRAELAKLSKEILYVPDFSLMKFSMFTAKLSNRDEEAADDVFEKYKYAYKVVSKPDLEKIITEWDKPAYYLVFIRNSSVKIVCVINSKTGETIYSRSTKLSYNLKSGDLKELFKEIGKQ